MPIKIDFLSNVRDLIRGTDDTEKALDDVADSLDDMADAAKKGGRDAERSVDDLEDSFRDAARRAKDLEDAGKDAGRSVERGMDRAEDGVNEFKDEANSTARESAASFDGSAESIGDAFQEIAANAFSGFGPAGAIAGLAAAAGIGLAIAGFEDVGEASEESKARAAEWADAFIEAGGRVLTFQQEMAKVQEIITDSEQYDKAIENADLWGVSLETAISAMSGSESAIAEVTAALKGQRDEVEKDEAAADRFADTYGKQTTAQKLARDEYERGASSLSELTGEIQRGGEAADVLNRILVDNARNTAGATEKVDEFGDTIITLPGGHEVYIDAETGKATEDTEAIENKIYGIRDQNVNINVGSSGLSAAQNEINRFVSRNNGREIKLHGRFTVDNGTDWD